jgi:hypothetical protein
MDQSKETLPVIEGIQVVILRSRLHTSAFTIVSPKKHPTDIYMRPPGYFSRSV